MTFEFELTDEQEQELEAVKHEAFYSGNGRFVISCQLILPSHDFLNVKTPKVKGRVFYGDEAQFLESAYRILSKARKANSEQ